MSTPCAKYATTGEVAQIKSSIKQTREQSKQQWDKYSQVHTTPKTESLTVGDTRYSATTNRNAVREIVNRQKSETKTMLKAKSKARSNLSAQEKMALAREESLRSALQGAIGERIASHVVGKVLGYQPVSYTKPGGNQGFDGIFRGPNGNLVIVEAKNTQDPTGIGSGCLAQYKSHGDREMDNSAISRIASYMVDPLTPYGGGNLQNAIVGQEILDVGAQNIEKLLVYTDPSSLNTIVSRWEDGNWEPFMALQPDFNDLSNS